ncbi:MAG: hypothetical protein IT464_06140 [Planctomycetes bacterium]|nr:hypothetical protein [Planctomycetota bacterium]
MHRTHVCVICAALTALFAALLLLAPSPASAQAASLSSAVTLGTKPEGEFKPLRVVVTVRMLGSDAPVPGFKLLALAKFAGLPHDTASFVTDEKGSAAISLNRKPGELRVFAFGDFVVPDGWSNVPLTTLERADATWDLYVRPLKNVRVSGRISVVGTEAQPKRANVSFAPLDVAQDGSSRLFDQPYSVLTGEDGSYDIELPTGYYQVWSYWSDRSGVDWVHYHKVENKVPIFGEIKINMALVRAPMFTGKVVDARTGKGIAATVDLYSNLYLRQLRNSAADGQLPDEYDANDEPVYWPIGTFKFQAWSINPDDFTAVIKPQGSESVLKVIPHLKASQFEGKEIVWELYTAEMRQVTIRVVTHEQDIPVMGLDVRLIPKKIDVPEHIQQTYTAGGMVDRDGNAQFLGLATGSYEVYGASGSTFLGNAVVTDAAKQDIVLKWAIPFAYGNVKLEGGGLCKNMVVFITMVNAAGREFGPYPSDAFKENPALQEKGMLFVPMLQFGSTFKLRFGAMEGGKAFTDDDWVRITDFPLATDEIEFKIDSEKGYKVDLTLKANPEFKAPLKND